MSGGDDDSLVAKLAAMLLDEREEGELDRDEYARFVDRARGPLFEPGFAQRIAAEVARQQAARGGRSVSVREAGDAEVTREFADRPRGAAMFFARADPSRKSVTYVGLALARRPFFRGRPACASCGSEARFLCRHAGAPEPRPFCSEACSAALCSAAVPLVGPRVGSKGTERNAKNEA